MIQGPSKLFEQIYKLPQLNQQIKNYADLASQIQKVSFQLNNQIKVNIDQIEKVCKYNSKLYAVARLLRQLIPSKGLKQNFFWSLISSTVAMFTLMMSSHKMIEFFNKHSIPFSIYRILIRAYTTYGKFQFFKKCEVQHCLKFILKMLSIKNKNFPRLFALLTLNILNQCQAKYPQKQKRSPDIYANKQSERIAECTKTIINIALDLIKFNLKLAAQSGILVAMYRKAIEGDLNLTDMNILIETIAHHMNTQQNRRIILGNMDLCRVFGFFTNVDPKPKQNKNQQRIQKCAIMIQLLLSSCSTLFYFIYQKVTLKNFVISLKSKSKSEKQLSIINEKIFKKLIDKALRYDRNKMQRSNNTFGVNSNYLNYRALLVLSFFLDSTELFQIYLNTDPNGSLFAGLGKISLMYFPITFEKGKYNKQIIQTIKLPFTSDYQRLSKDFLSILSYYDYCIIPYQFTKIQLISYLLQIKQLDCYKDQIPPQHKVSIDQLLIKAKQSTNQHSVQQFHNLLLNFYIKIMQICEILLWKPQYLKLSKFLSLLIEYLKNYKLQQIRQACLAVVCKIFTNPKPNYYRYLYITALDDAGKYFQNHEKVTDLITVHLRSSQYAFRISRILQHADLNKSVQQGINGQRTKLQVICESGCEELILQAIQIIRFYCIDNDDKAEWGVHIVCGKLIYHSSQQIACSAVQFCQQFVANHRSHKLYLNKIQLGNIKDINLRKRIMYLLLTSQKGIDQLNAYNPNFIRDQIDLWLKQGHNLTKQLSLFLSKQSRKFITNRDSPFLDIGKGSQNRHKLIFMPWNVQINQKSYIALASYKYLSQKIKLKITPELLIENKIEIFFFDIGGFAVTSKNQTKSMISVKKQEIIKNYQRNKIKQNKEIKKFAISKQNATFFFKYQAGCLVLKKVILDIPLARDVYRSIPYPLSFLSLMTKTGKGFTYLRAQKIIQQSVKICKYKQEKDEKEVDIQLSKGAIQCMGLLFASWKLEMLEKIQIFMVVNQIFEKTSNFQLKQVALWALNIIVKDDDLRRKLKQCKGWLILQSKYCGWLCYPQFYNSNQSQFSKIVLNQFNHIKPPLLPQKLNNEGYRLILSVLEVIQKNESDIQLLKNRKDQMIIYFKKVQNRQIIWDPKLLERVVMYVSVVNFGIQRTSQILDLFTSYYLSDKFDTDFAFGSSLP